MPTDIRIHIVGVGSPHGDDRLGWVAAGELRRSAGLAALPPLTLTIAERDRPGMDLLQGLEGLTALIVVDAVCTGLAPGTLHRLTGDEIGGAAGTLSSHGFGLAAALELGRAMGCLPPRVAVFGLEIADTGGEALSPAVKAAMPGLVAAVEREVLDQISRGGSDRDAPAQQED
ncbi:MAG: hydrogenase maturation protease [Acidiferrobacterales bacterium]